MAEVNPFERGIGIALHQHKWGIRRKVRNENVTVEAEGHTLSKDAIAMSKKLLKCDEYDAILSADRRIRDKLERLSLPSMLRRGVYLIPFPHLEEADREIDEYMGLRITLEDDFIAVLDRAVSAAEDRLGPLFDETQYPSIAEVRAKFSVEKEYVNLGLPSNLEKIDSAIASRARKALDAKMADASKEMRAALRYGLHEIWSHLFNQLTGTTPTGRPKVVRESAVEKIHDFLGIFDAKNLTDDDALQGVVSKCRNLLDGVDVEELRQGDTRVKMAKQVAAINDELSKLVQETPRRQFSFDEED